MAKHKNDNHIYAIKVLKKEAIINRNEVKHIMAERNVLIRNLDHPFLVSLKYSFQSADKLYFVLDYVNGGEVSLCSFFYISVSAVV
jgi:serine/threonine protein kinase